MSVLNDPALETRLAALHARSNSQSDDRPTENQTQREFLSDKLVALDSDKAEFCYQICRAIGASNIIDPRSSWRPASADWPVTLREPQHLAR